MLPVMWNDSDPDADSLSVTAVTTPQHGSAYANFDYYSYTYNVAYTPTTAYTGTDAFNYTVSDGTDSASASLGLTVHQIDNTIAQSRPLTLQNNVRLVTGGIIGDGPQSWSDVDLFSVSLTAGQVIKFDIDSSSIDGGSSYGSLNALLRLFNSAGTQVVYNDSGTDPDTGIASSDAYLTYTVTTSGTYYLGVSDSSNSNYSPALSGGGYSMTSGAYLLQVLRETPNQDPIAAADSAATHFNTQVTIPVLVNDTDPNGDTLTLTESLDGSHGTTQVISVNGTSQIVYTPTTGYVGSDSFTYTISDPFGATSTATVSVTVTNTNPVAQSDTYEAVAGVSRVVSGSGVLANDSDADGDVLSVILVSSVSHGTLTLNANGSFTYIATSGYLGTDSFVYRANDGAGNSADTTVMLSVYPTNVTAFSDAYSIGHDKTLTVASPGVLANDWDFEHQTLTAVLVSTTAHGTLTLNSNGSFEYVPTAGFVGTDSFIYKATDGTNESAAITVPISVTNFAPWSVNDYYTVSHDRILSRTASNGLLSNDVDVEGDTLTVSLVTIPATGTLVLNADGSFDYTPLAATTGTQTFTYKISDGFNLSQNATAAISIVNSTPSPAADLVFTPSGQALAISLATLIGNDVDSDGDTMTLAISSTTTHGSLTTQLDGSLLYQPNAGFSGTDTFQYTLTDGLATSSPVDVRIRVNNAAPLGIVDFYSTRHDHQLVVTTNSVVANDIDDDNDTLTVVLESAPTTGSLILNADGTFVYTPTAGYVGDVTFTYRVTDGIVTSSPIVATIHVTNAAPIGRTDAFNVHQGQTLVVPVETGLLQNDSDADSDALTISLQTTTAHGILTLAANGSFTYTPAAGFAGSDSFTYRVADGIVTSDPITVSLTVSNIRPSATANSYVVLHDQLLVVPAATGVVANDFDVDGDTLTAALVTGPAHGSLVLQPDGSFSFTPNAAYVGNDSFVYKVYDGAAFSDSVTVTITVSNQRPWSVNRSFAVLHDHTITIASPGLFAFSGDGDSDVLTIVAGAVPSHGTVTINANGSFTYIPTAGYVGTDSFGYRVSDGVSFSVISTVSISVFNSVPIATADSYRISHDRTLTVDVLHGVLANDRDLNADPLTATFVAGHDTQHGTLTLNANGSFGYVPHAGFVGTDTFRYRITDGAQTADADVTITVINQNPVAVNDKYGATVEQTLTVNAAAGVLFNDSDADLDAIQAVLVSGTSHGTLSLNSDGSFSYTPAAGFIGVDEFRYKAKDPLNLNSFVATVSISTALVAGDEEYTVSHDRTLTGNVEANDFSISGTPPVYELLSAPASGTFVLNPNGTFSYTPIANYVGQQTFTYKFRVNGYYSNVATATIDVVNEAPLVFTGTWRASHGQTITASVETGLAFRSRDRDGDSMTFSVVTQPTHGTLTLQSNGSFVYVPNDPAYTGPDSFTWKAFDGLLYSEVKTAHIELLNHKATVTADSYGVHSGQTLTVSAVNGVLSNDYDSDSDTLQAQISAQPTQGTVTLAADGSFVYTPNAGVINATDTFTYRVFDGAEPSAEGTVSVRIANAIPFATATKYRTHQGTTLVVATAHGLMNSASDTDGDSITPQLVNGTLHGSILVSADGSFTYAPNAGWTGTDSFTYSLSDGFATSAAITVQLEVQNNAASVVDDWFAMRRNQTITITAADLLHNDADPDHDSLSVTISVNPAHGTLTQTSPGVWNYAPNTNYIGTDTFKYVVHDGASTSAAATVEVEVKNSAPQGGDDRFLIPHGRSFTTTTPEILENDYDADGDILTATLVSGVSHGSLTLNSNGTFTYVPAAGYVGTDSFEYRTSDGASNSNISLVTFDVRNNAPQIHEQYHRMKHDQVLTVDATSGLRYYVVDPESDVITPVILATTAHGTLNVASDGSWTYTPNAGFVGKDSFTWRASDGVDQSDPAIVTIDVTNVDVVTSPDYYTLSSNQTLTVAAPGVLKNDLNLDQDSLTLTVVNPVEHGLLTLNSNGSFTYTPAAGFAGADQFTYKISDGVSQSYAKVTLQVGRSASGTSQFSVRPDHFSVNALGTLLVTSDGGVVANDSYATSGAAPIVQLVTAPARGTLTLNTTGSFTYVPNAGIMPFAGTDSFVYRLTNSAGHTATSTAQIDVVNHAPASIGVLLEVHQGKTLDSAASQLKAASNDAEGHTLTYSALTSPTHGTLTFHANGHFVYVPTAGYSGLDSFTWRANDGIANGNTSTVTINVANQRPTLISNSYRTNSGQQLVVSGNGVRSTASDADGDTLTVSVVQTTQHGVLAMAADGTFTYTPAAGFSGRDTFRARVFDGAANSSDVVFAIDVENALPVATGSNATLRHGTSTTLNMAAYDSDGDALVYELTTAPAHGTLTYTNLISNGANGTPIRFTGTVTYTPSPTYAGNDEVKFRVTDGVGFSEPATIRINVLNSTPTAREAYHAIDAGTSLAVAAPGLLGQSLDADGDSMTLQIVTQPGHGTLTLTQTGGTPNGGFTYQPAAGFAGVDSFTWRISDGISWSNPVTETIAVNNSAPVLRDRSFHSTYSEGTAVNSSTRQYHYDLATLNTAFDLDSDPVTFQIVTNAAHGTATVTAAGAITYTPTSSTYIGNDEFTVRGFDGYSWSEPSKVRITIDNEAPLAIGDSFSVHHGTSVTLAAAVLLGNDYDFDGDTMHIVSVTNGANGTLTQNGTTWTYNPGSFIGKTSLTYVVSDGLVNSEPATIEIEVTNAAVWGIDRSMTLTESSSIEFEISTAAGTVWSPDGDAVTVSFSQQPANGTLTSLGNNRWRYTPTPTTSTNSGSGIPVVTRGFLGHDSIRFTLSDGVTVSTPVTYSFLVVDLLATLDGLASSNTVGIYQNPVMMVSPPPPAGFTPVDSEAIASADIKYHKVRPGQAATGQLETGASSVAAVWSGTSWINVTGGGTTVILSDGGSIMMTPTGTYTMIPPSGATGGKSTARIRLSSGTFLAESTIVTEAVNHAPILASPYASGTGATKTLDLQTGQIDSMLSSFSGSVGSFKGDIDGDFVAFTEQVVPGLYGNLTIYSGGDFSYSMSVSPHQSMTEELEISVSDAFGAITTAILRLAVGVEWVYLPPNPPANQQHPPAAGSLNGTFLTSAVAIGAVSGASDSGYPGLTFELLGDGKGTYGKLTMSGPSAWYLPYSWQEGAFLKLGHEPTKFKYKVTNGLGEWTIGTVDVKATLIGNGQSVSYNGVTVTSEADVIGVALFGTHPVWTAAPSGVVGDATFSVIGGGVYWTGNAATRISVVSQGSVTSPIVVSGSAYVLSGFGDIKQPVIASRVSRVHALNGYYHSVVSASSVDWVKMRFPYSIQPKVESVGAVKAGTHIGYVEWSDSNPANIVTWTAPLNAGTSINTLRISGHLQSALTAGTNIGGIDVSGTITGTISAGQRIGGGAEYDYFSAAQVTPSYETPTAVTSTNGDVRAILIAGTDVLHVRSLTGEVNSIIVAGHNVGLVETPAGRINSIIFAGHAIHQISGNTGVEGLILAVSAIGMVWSAQDVSAFVQSRLDVGTIMAWANITGYVSALGGSITRISAGTSAWNNHEPTGGSITSPTIQAGKSIGRVTARQLLSSFGLPIGGRITVPGGITATTGYVHEVNATQDINATIKASDDIGTVTAGTFIKGNITSESGSILAVTSGTGRIEGEIKAEKKNIGNVTAGTDRLGKTTATLGSIGNITATTGKIDGEINGLKGLGNITAGTSIHQSITAAGAGANAAHIRAGAHTAGSISGAIFVNGNILSVIATAVSDEDLPSIEAATGSWYFSVSADGKPVKPERLKLSIPVVYAEGNITGGITTGGGIFNVLAHGKISNDIAAGAELPKVLAYRNINGSVSSGVGATDVKTFGGLNGEVTTVGNATVWAYDDIAKKIQSSSGSVAATTWGKMLGSALAQTPAIVRAYGDIQNDQIKSNTGTTSVTSFGSLKSNIEAYLHNITLAIGDVSGSQVASMGKGLIASAADWNADVEAGRDVVAQVLGDMKASLIANTGNVDVRLTRVFRGEVDAKQNAFLYVRDYIISAQITAKNGSVYADAGGLHSSTIAAPRGSIGLNIFGSVSNATVKSAGIAALYARSNVLELTMETQWGSAQVFTTHMFRGNVTTKGVGNAAVVAWDGMEGKINAEKANANVLSYGTMQAEVTAGKNVNAAVWGSISGKLTADESIKAFARNNITGAVTGGSGTVKLVAGGNVSSQVSNSLDVLNPAWTVSITAFGNVSGTVRGSGSVAVAADHITSPDIESKSGGITLTAIHNVESKANAVSDINIAAGFLITSPRIRSSGGSVRLATSGSISNAGVTAAGPVNASARLSINSLEAVSGAESTIVSLGTIADSVLIALNGDISAFAGESAKMSLTSKTGDVSVTAVDSLSGSYSGKNEVYLISFGTLTDLTANGDVLVAFGLNKLDATLAGRTLAAAESVKSVSGSVTAVSSQVFAGLDSSATINSWKFSYVTAGTDISGSVSSDGNATAISQGRGKKSGSITANVTGDQSAKAMAIGGSIQSTIKSDQGEALAFAGVNISGTVDGGTNAGAFAVGDISGGEVKAKGSAKAKALGTIGSKVTAESGFALAMAGKSVTGEIKAKKNAVAVSFSGAVTGKVESEAASTFVVAMDGISGTVKAHRHAVALAYGSVTGQITATEGSALVVSVAGGVTKDVTAGRYAAVIAFNNVDGKIEADKSILVATLGNVTGAIDAGEYAIVLAAGEVSGSSVTAGKSALVVALGNVNSSVTAEDGSLLILTLGNVTATLSATEFVVVVAAGDVKISVPQSQDLIVISGGKTTYTFLTQQQESDAAAGYSGFAGTAPAAAASRDLILFGLGGVEGNVSSGRDAVLVSMGSSSANVNAVGDAILYAFDGIHRTSQNLIPRVTGGGDAILISGSSATANVTGGKNAILMSLGSASDSTVSGNQYAGVLTLGAGLNLFVNGTDGAFAWTYGDFSGTVTSSGGSAVASSIGNAFMAKRMRLPPLSVHFQERSPQKMNTPGSSHC